MHNAGGLLGPRGLAVPLAAEYEYDSTSGSRSNVIRSDVTPQRSCKLQVQHLYATRAPARLPAACWHFVRLARLFVSARLALLGCCSVPVAACALLLICCGAGLVLGPSGHLLYTLALLSDDVVETCTVVRMAPIQSWTVPWVLPWRLASDYAKRMLRRHQRRRQG